MNIKNYRRNMSVFKLKREIHISGDNHQTSIYSQKFQFISYVHTFINSGTYYSRNDPAYRNKSKHPQVSNLNHVNLSFQAVTKSL